MFNQSKKYIRQGIIFIVIILVSWLIIYPSLVFQYSFDTLPIVYTLLFIINLVIVYLFLRIHLKHRREIVKLESRQQSSESDTEETIIEDSKILTDEEKEFNKHLLKGITKKTSKKAFAEKLLSNLVKLIEAEVGVYYTYIKKAKAFQVAATYAYFSDEQPVDFKTGEGINGQVVKNKKSMLIKDASETHITVVSGLGEGKPKYLFIYPVILDEQVIALIELASFTKFPEQLDSELTGFFESNREKFLNIDDK